jgi:pyruvate dehydrogenase E2 component (dihydrolipoamide acetyltransferase)
MASLIRMPGISADAEEAALVEWFVEVGAEISQGSALASVETEKATVDIDSDESGVVWKLLAVPGEAVAVGAPIAIIVAVGEDTSNEAVIMAAVGLGGASSAPAVAVEVSAPSAADAPSVPAVAAAVEVAPDVAVAAAASDAPVGGQWRRFSSPLARKIAQEKGIDLSTVTGSGPGGRILRDDLAGLSATVSAAVPTEAPAPAPARPAAGELVPHSKLRLAVANALGNSKRNSPHFYLTASARVDGLMALRAQINEQSSTRISVNDLVIKAVAQAFVDVPEMNVQWRDEGLLTLGSIDISVAIASDKGLVTPIIRQADQARVTEIARSVKDYVQAANEGRLKQTDLEGGSFTVTNLGMFGVDEFSAIINPPQVGILAVGAVTRQPVVEEDGSLGVGLVMKVTLSADHRPVDGALGALWLQALKKHLESPLAMLA